MKKIQFFYFLKSFFSLNFLLNFFLGCTNIIRAKLLVHWFQPNFLPKKIEIWMRLQHFSIKRRRAPFTSHYFVSKTGNLHFIIDHKNRSIFLRTTIFQCCNILSPIHLLWWKIMNKWINLSGKIMLVLKELITLPGVAWNNIPVLRCSTRMLLLTPSEHQ